MSNKLGPEPFTIPDNMVEVSQDKFYSVIGPRDVLPNNEHPEFTTWETPSRQVLGQTYPGWKWSGDPRFEHRFALVRNLV